MSRLGDLAGPAAGAFLDGALLFSAADADYGRELWRSDGTPRGTGLLLDLNLDDFGGSYPTGLLPAAGKAWFFAQDGIHGFELWASDGTEAGTILVDELTPGAGPDLPPGFTSAAELAGRALLLLRLTGQSASIWSSDGTPGSSVRLTPPDLQVLAQEPLRAAAGRVFFSAADAEHGQELWATDGTVSGTRMVADMEPGSVGSQPRSLTVFGNQLFFTAAVGDAGRELWASDGTPGGTVLVKDVDPRPGRSSDPLLLTVHAGRLFFPATDEEHGRELWSSDGTQAGTLLAAEITPGADGVFMTHLVSTGSRLFFSGGPADETQQGLWVTDGTAAGSRQLSNRLIQVNLRPIAAPGAFDGQIFFATDGDQVLWHSDGTEEGTEPLLDAEGLEIDEPEAYRAFDGRLYFTAEDHFYQTDGTEAGTFAVQSLVSPAELAGQGAPFELTTAGGRLLFRSWERMTGSELWALEDE